MGKISNESGLIPTGDRVLVELFKVEETTAGGLVIPKQSQDKEQVAQMVGTVVAFGSAATDFAEFSDISEGDTVLFARYSGADIPWKQGERVYRVMRAQDIVGKVTKPPEFAIRAAKSSAEAFPTAAVA
jgi:co-chaperonin GroES (HSP10)